MTKRFIDLIVVLLLASACTTSDLHRQQAQLHLRIGTGYLAQGHNPQALTELIKAEEMDPDEPVIQNNLGLAFYMRKEYGLAEKHILNAVKINPRYSDARNNLGRLYTDLSRYDDAIKQLTMVTKDLTYTTPEKAFLNLGIAYMKKGDLIRALNTFKRSMDVNSHYCPAFNYYGQVQFQQHKFAEAIESFEQALALCNNYYDEAHYYSALSYYKLGQTEKAMARLEEIEKIYPESEYAAKAKGMLKIIR